jgi:hypothetical protein
VTTGFLQIYNPTVTVLRERLGWWCVDFVRIDATGGTRSAWNARIGLFVRHPDVA